MKVESKVRKMSTSYNDVPVGIRFIRSISGRCCRTIRFKKEILCKCSVLILTFLAYTCYHMTRKPTSVVRSVLHRNCSGLPPPAPNSSNNWCDYAPFDKEDASKLFGALDSAFLFCYAGAMFVSGFVAERVSLRYFLTIGMILSGLFTALFGVAKILDIHNLWYFVFVQAFAGIFQTTGWPGVVTVVDRWFGKSKRGLIFGIWNSHTSIGNILGNVIPAAFLKTDWSMSFIVPGAIMGCMGIVLYLFLIETPELVSCQQRPAVRRVSNASDAETETASTNHDIGNNSTSDEEAISEHTARNIGSVNAEIIHRPTERTPMIRRESSQHLHVKRPISIQRALKIPGVIEFSLCLFFSKLVSYTFLFWLPFYIENSTTLDPQYSAYLSSLFDIGGIIGAIAAGVISDYTSMPASTCTMMFFFAAPTLLIYHQYGAVSWLINITLLLALGILVNGPYALITTSVSAELGQHRMLEGNDKAVATVTAIIDGTGSIGAAVGPLLAGVVSSSGWHNVFYMLISSDILAMLLLLRLLIQEISRRETRSYIRIE